jgi:hypothetical protein
MEQTGTHIEIGPAERPCRLVADQFTVSYIALTDGTLWCIDEHGEQGALGWPPFRFASVNWLDRRITAGGRVNIRIGEVWIDFGPLVPDKPANGLVASLWPGEAADAPPLLDYNDSEDLP